jgi:hypothetical protein
VYVATRGGVAGGHGGNGGQGVEHLVAGWQLARGRGCSLLRGA